MCYIVYCTTVLSVCFFSISNIFAGEEEITLGVPKKLGVGGGRLNIKGKWNWSEDWWGLYTNEKLGWKTILIK